MLLAGLMLVLGVVAAFFALAMSSQVNAAAVAAGLACFCAIIARIGQADAHHRALMYPKKDKATVPMTLECPACHHVQTRGPSTCEQCGGSMKQAVSPVTA